MTATLAAPPFPFPAAEFPPVSKVVPPTWGLWLPGGGWQVHNDRRKWLVSQGWDDRRLRLLACAFAGRTVPWYERRWPGDSRPRRAVEVAARYADGLATEEELAVVNKDAWAAAADAAAAAAAAAAADAAADADAAAYADAERVAQSRIVSLWCPAPDWSPDLETINARGLAAAIYAEGRWDRMPILADALEDAGYGGWLLDAMRYPGVPWGPGCWVVDRLTGRIEA